MRHSYSSHPIERADPGERQRRSAWRGERDQKPNGSGSRKEREKQKKGGKKSPNGPRGKKQNRRKAGFWVILILAMFLALAVYFMLNHKAFNIKYIRVEGNDVIPTEEVLEKLGPVHANIFRYKSSTGEEKLKDLSGLRSVSIEKKIPNRLVVKVSEAYYIAVFHSGDKVYNVDNEGIVDEKMDLDKAGRLEPLKITGSFEQITDGKKLFNDDRYIRFLDILARTKLARDTQKVDFEKINNIVIMYKNIYVHFGPPDDVYNKLSALTAVMKELASKKINPKEIILNEGKNPIVVTR